MKVEFMCYRCNEEKMFDEVEKIVTESHENFNVSFPIQYCVCEECGYNYSTYEDDKINVKNYAQSLVNYAKENDMLLDDIISSELNKFYSEEYERCDRSREMECGIDLEVDGIINAILREAKVPNSSTSHSVDVGPGYDAKFYVWSWIENGGLFFTEYLYESC